MTLYFNTAVVKEGGAEPVIESLQITPTAQQQLIEAPTGVDGYSPITVEAAAQPVIESLSITPTSSEQLIEAPEGVDGYSPITVAAVPGDNAPEIQYVQYQFSEKYKGDLVFSSTMLKNLFEAIQEGDGEYLALMTCTCPFEYDYNNQIIYVPASTLVGYFCDDAQDVMDVVSLELNSTRIINKPSKLYIQLYTNDPHGYLDIVTTLPSDVSWYQRAWSCDVTYDDNEPSFNLTNFQRIGV